MAGFRGTDGLSEGKGEINPKQLDQYVENGCFWRHEFSPTERYFKHSNKAYLEKAVDLGLIGAPNQIILQLYVEPLQKFRLAAEGRQMNTAIELKPILIHSPFIIHHLKRPSQILILFPCTL